MKHAFWCFIKWTDGVRGQSVALLQLGLKIPKENVIGLAFEPNKFLNLNKEFIIYAQKHIGKYLIGDASNLPSPFVSHFGYMWYSLPPKEITIKPNIFSGNLLTNNLRRFTIRPKVFLGEFYCDN